MTNSAYFAYRKPGVDCRAICDRLKNAGVTATLGLEKSHDIDADFA